jgi:hypothetical protein
MEEQIVGVRKIFKKNLRTERKPSASVLEVIRGESRKLSSEILRRVRAEMTNGSEGKLAREKNCPWRSWNNRSEQGETGEADIGRPGSVERKVERLEGTGTEGTG